MTDAPVAMLDTIDLVAVMSSTQTVQDSANNSKAPGSIPKNRNHL